MGLKTFFGEDIDEMEEKVRIGESTLTWDGLHISELTHKELLERYTQMFFECERQKARTRKDCDLFLDIEDARRELQPHGYLSDNIFIHR